MIVFYNVCDNCGSQNKVVEGDDQFKMKFHTQALYKVIAHESDYKEPKYELTFCDRDCLITYFTEKMKINGEILGNED